VINILVILFVVWVSFKRYKVQSGIHGLSERLDNYTINVERIRKDIYGFQSYANGYVVNGNLQYYNNANKLIFNAQEHIENLKAEISDQPEERTSLNTLESATAKLITSHVELMDKRRYKDIKTSGADASSEIIRLNNVIDNSIKTLLASEKQNFERETTLALSHSNLYKIALIIASVVSLLLLIAVLFILRQYLKIKTRDEKKIRENDRLLQSITDNTSSSIFIKEVSGKYILTNNQFEYLFRGKSDHIKGKTDYDIFPKEIADLRRDKDIEIFKTGNEVKYEEVLPHADGQLHTYITVKFPVKDSENRIYAIGGISTDITENRNTVAKMHDSEDQVRRIYESAPDAIIVIDEESKILKWNKKAEELFKWKAEEVVGNPLYDFIMPARYKDQHLKGIHHFIRTGEGPMMNRTVEITARNKEDKEIDIELTISASKSQDHYIFIAFIREITKRKQLEKESVQVKNFLDSVIDNIPDMIFVKDAEELKFVRLNKAGERLLGLKQLDVINKNDYNFFPKDQADFFTSKDRQVLEKDEVVDIPEEAIDTKQGKKWLHTKKITIKDEKGKPAFLLGISEDITERKKLENEKNAAFEQLRQAEEKTTLILENIGDAVIATDDKLQISFMNPIAEKLTGWSEDEVRGKHVDEIFKIVNEFTRESVQNPIATAIGEKRIVDLARNTVLIKKDNTEIFINDTGSPILDKNGNVTGAVLIFSDITEQRKIEQLAEESNKKFIHVFNFSPVPLSISTMEEGKLLYVNDAFCKTLGFTREELIGKTSVELNIVSAADRNNILNYSKKTGGSIKDIESRVKRKDGSFLDVLFSVEIVEMEQIQCAVIAFVNITERKNSEQRIAMVLENIGEGVIVADARERILLSNHIADEILGIDGRYYSSDWTDRYDIFYPDGSVFPAQNLPLEKALKGIPSDEVEIVLEDRETKNQKLLKVSGQPIINQENKIIAAVATLKDITKYKEMEKALEETELKYRKLIGFRRSEDKKEDEKNE
jgi:PAS domain S-box-containing protein